MKKFVLLASVALVASCGSKTETPEATATDESMPAEVTASGTGATTANGAAPGSYDVTAPDGTQMVSTLMADGTYVDRDTAGKVTEKGTWAVRDGKTCFDPEGDEAEICYTEGAQNADGSFDATGPDGKVTKVKPHAA